MFSSGTGATPFGDGTDLNNARVPPVMCIGLGCARGDCCATGAAPPGRAAGGGGAESPEGKVLTVRDEPRADSTRREPTEKLDAVSDSSEEIFSAASLLVLAVSHSGIIFVCFCVWEFWGS